MQEEKAQRRDAKEAKKNAEPKKRGRPPKKPTANRKEHSKRKTAKSRGSKEAKTTRVSKSKRAKPEEKEQEAAKDLEMEMGAEKEKEAAKDIEVERGEDKEKEEAAKRGKRSERKEIPREAEIFREYQCKVGSSKRFNRKTAENLGMKLPDIPAFEHCKVVPYWNRAAVGLEIADLERKTKSREIAHIRIPGVKDVAVIDMVLELVP